MTEDSDNASGVKKSHSWLKCFTQLFSKQPKSLDDLVGILRDAQKNELLGVEPLRMIEGVLQVAEMRVSEIMISRADMVCIDKDASFEEILPIAIRSGHSRFPVIGENKDEILGILLAKDLLNYSLTDRESKFMIKEILRSAVFVPESKRLSILLNEFRRNRNHIAIVVDEYGGVSGLVTIEDVLEQIVGDIEDEHDIDKNVTIREHKDHTYSVKALTPIEDFNAFFKTEFDTDEYDTIGGLVLKAFGRLPKRGDTVDFEGMHFTVLRASRRRILLLQVTQKTEPTTQDAS